MRETSTSMIRRLHDSNFLRFYFNGDGVDIGGLPDPLLLYQEFFPLCRSIKTWDLSDGDAQFMRDVRDETFDFVYSSHCLEHLNDPKEALENWVRILKPGGHIIVTVPDEDLYEQGVWPSTFNRDHKSTFTIYKSKSWSPSSLNLTDLLTSLHNIEIVKLEKINFDYRFSLPRYDRTITPVGESAIEFILHKPLLKINEKSKYDERLNVYLNQYVDDYASMKRANANTAPFSNKNFPGK